MDGNAGELANLQRRVDTLERTARDSAEILGGIKTALLDVGRQVAELAPVGSRAWQQLAEVAEALEELRTCVRTRGLIVEDAAGEPRIAVLADSIDDGPALVVHNADGKQVARVGVDAARAGAVSVCDAGGRVRAAIGVQDGVGRVVTVAG